MGETEKEQQHALNDAKKEDGGRHQTKARLCYCNVHSHFFFACQCAVTRFYVCRVMDLNSFVSTFPSSIGPCFVFRRCDVRGKMISLTVCKHFSFLRLGFPIASTAAAAAAAATVTDVSLSAHESSYTHLFVQHCTAQHSTARYCPLRLESFFFSSARVGGVAQISPFLSLSLPLFSLTENALKKKQIPPHTQSCALTLPQKDVRACLYWTSRRLRVGAQPFDYLLSHFQGLSKASFFYVYTHTHTHTEAEIDRVSL